MLFIMPPRVASKSPAGSQTWSEFIKARVNCDGGLKKANTRRKRNSAEVGCGRTGKSWSRSKHATEARATALKMAMGIDPRQLLRVWQEPGISDPSAWVALLDPRRQTQS